MAYLGIDESLGSFGEIVVAVPSGNPDALKEADFSKSSRRRNLKDLLEIDFRYLIITPQQKDVLGYNGARAAAVCALVGEFSGLERVLIDGDSTSKIRAMLHLFLGEDLWSILSFEPQGDERFGILNTADAVAYALNLYHQNLGNENVYEERLVALDVNECLAKTKEAKKPTRKNTIMVYSDPLPQPTLFQSLSWM